MLDLMTNHPVESWWAPWQLALVEDRARVWQRAQFAASGAVEVVVDGQRLIRTVAPGEVATQSEGWDHEHCALCYGKISLVQPNDSVGYFNGADWLCVECFTTFME